MTTFLVTRHPGALEWLTAQGWPHARPIAHLDPAEVGPGDQVIGTLPVHLAAVVCARGTNYWNLSLDLPPHARGRELSAQELSAFGARLERYDVRRVHEARNVLS